MPSPNRKRYRLGEIVQELRQDRPGIEVEADDGQVFTVPPPELWPDEAIELTDKDPVGAARAVLGAEQYARWRESGGTAALLFAIIGKESGAQLGESAASTDS